MELLRRFRFLFIGLIVFALLMASKSFAQDVDLDPTKRTRVMQQCKLSDPAGTFCIGHINQLTPTQYSVGMLAVKKKANKLAGMDPVEYMEYILARPVPVVIGNGKFNMLDHHHLSRAVRYNGNNDIIVQVRENWNELSVSDFEARMNERRFYYLKDESGKPITREQLPSQVDDLKDDPYRTLSGEVEDKGGFIKRESDFYIEFAWADFFRTRFSVEEIEKDLKKTTKKAVIIAHSPEAAGMPGYVPAPPAPISPVVEPETRTGCQ